MVIIFRKHKQLLYLFKEVENIVTINQTLHIVDMTILGYHGI